MKRSWAARAGALVFWLAVWQAAAMAIGQEVFLVSPLRALVTLAGLLPTADFWGRVAFSSGRILLGFLLGAVSSVLLAAAAHRLSWVELLLAPVMQLVKATPVASFIILALVWVRGSSLSTLIGFLMVLPVLYGAVQTGIRSADPPAVGDGPGLPSAGGAAAAGHLAARRPACFPPGVQRGPGHLLEKRRRRRGHRPAQRQHRRRPLPGQDHPFHRGALRLDLCDYLPQRRL